MSAVSGAIRAADMSVAAIGAVDYAQALDGLSLKQAQLMLTTQGIVGEEQRQILIRQGLIATSDNISAKLTYQALQTTALTKAEQQEMLIEMGLMDKKSKQLLLTNSCTEAELRAQLTKRGYIGTQQDEIVTAILGTGVREKEAISWKVLTTSILESAKAMLVWLATNPVGQMIIAAGVIAGVAGAYDLLTMSVEEAQESLEEFNQACSDLDSATTELQSIDENIKSIQDKGTLSLTDQADLSRLEQEKSLLEKEIQLLERKKELTSEKSNSDAVKAVNDGTYKNGDGFFSRSVDDLTKAIMQGELDSSSSQEYLRERGKKTINDVKIELAEIQRRNMELLGQITGTDEDSQNAKKQLQEYIDYVNKYLYTVEELQKMKFDGFLSENESIKNAFNDLSKNGADVTSDSIEKLANKFPALKTYMDENGISAETLAVEFAKTSSEAENSGGNIDKTIASLSDLEKASNKIKTLSSAFKELSDDGYITTKTLGEIQTATGLTDDEWAKYENKLLNVKKGSTEFNQLMSELTYKILDQTFAQKELTDITEDQIAAVLRENGVVNADAVAHQYLAVKKEKARLETEGLIFATTDEAVALLNEANASEITQRALAQLALEKMAVNQVQINTSGDIDNVIALANAAGASVMALARLRAAKANLAAVGNGTITNIGDLRRLESAETTMRQIENGTFDFEYQKLDPNDFKVDYSGVGGGKSKGGGGGGSDNKPDKKDDTDAIINRINLRSKELEQQEEDIENSIEISALEKDYNKQISLTNDLIGARKTRVKELQLANVNLHNEAEKLRNNTEQWNEEEWFDSQGNATEAYIDLYNKSSKSQQELMEEQFEKISKYKKAYLDNAEEISEINKQLIQDEEDLSELYHTLYEVTISDIEHNKEMVLNKDPFADITSFYTQLQEEYHKEAERLRALDPEKYKEEIQKLQQQWWDAEQGKSDWRWDNSQRWIEQRNTFNDWKLFDDSEIKAWERVVKWLKEEYPNDLERIQEAEKSLFEARKAEFEKANDFANTYLDSRKTLLQSYYDVANAVAEAQHEINKELETSKTMYEWLNEDTRKLLFNQEDYNILSEELYDIQHKADKLQREYQRALASSSLETIESITSQYEMQYETLMKSYEIAKADLEIAKKKQKLNNVLNERNVRMFINGQWQWVANTEDVINAKAELADAEYAKRVEEAGLTQQQSIDNLTRRQDELTVVINKFENGIISLDEAVTLAKEAIGSLPNALYSLYGNSSSKSKNSYSVNSTSGGRTFYVGADGNAPKVATIGDTIKTSDGDYKIVPAGTYGAKYNSSSGRWSIKIKEKNAKGNRYTAGGMTLMGEIKDEMLISNDGHIIPINQPTIANIGTGGIVFNHEQMEAARKIWDMTNLSIPNYSNLMNRTSNITEHTIDNRIIINGMTVDSGSADGQALINALRRYVGNH